ncbi:hypothetical protein IKG24_01025 [Candidatus Saccharibacteria bacterium]|nr:hypothetical protein [Candidatus Saccharibacteria bacterium]
MLKQIFKQLSDSRAHANNLNNYIKTNKIIRSAGMGASFLLFVFALLASFPIVPHTDIVEAASPSESETKIEMSIGKGSANLSLIPKDMSGTFASSSSSELAEFNVTTNNYTGYTLGIKATDDTKQLTNVDMPTAKLDSITSIIDSSTFNTQAYNGKWGYKPSKYNSADNTSFRPAPTTSGSELNKTLCANGDPTTLCPDNQAKDTYTIGLGARVDYTKPVGTYSNTFVLTAVGNPVAYTLNYLDNTGDTSVSNMPATNSGTTVATKVQIASNIPTRTGYTFAGWCDQAPTVNADGSTTCGGSTYKASTTEDPVYYSFINQTLQNSIGNVYATWNITSYLQTVQVRYQTATGGWGNYSTYSACTKNVNYGSTHSCSIAATTEYQAASLASYTVTGANTKQIDVYRNTRTVSLTKGTGISAVSVTGTGVKSGSGTASATVYYGGAVTISASLTSGYDWVNWTGSATYTSQSQAISSVTSNLSFTANGKVSCQSSISGTMQAFNPSNLCSTATSSGTLTDSRDNQTYTVAKINDQWWMTKNLNLAGGTALTPADSNVSAGCNLGSNCTLPTSSTSGFSNNSTAYVYNSGRTTCGNSSPCYSYYSYVAATAGTNPSSGDATSDICPKGWRLPTRAEFNTLRSNYTTGVALTASPFLGVYAGSYYKSSFYDGGLYGYYWSSTAGNTAANRLYFDSSNTDDSSVGKNNGYSIRCVLQ